MESAAELNGRLAIGDRLQFVTGASGLPHALIGAPAAQAEVALQGGHVLRYQPAGAPALLFVSERAVLAPGRAVRGGAPVCWPWFGPRPGLPQHGFVRTAPWAADAGGADGDSTWLRLTLADSAATRALWPHAFSLALTVRVGAALTIELTATNRDVAPLSWTGALHTYLAVGDIGQVALHGLDGARYRDQVLGEEQTQRGALTIDREVDRVYRDASPALELADAALGRTIRIAKRGSASTVVWNPWRERAQAIADLADDEYRRFLCVETANADDDAVGLAPGASATMAVTVTVEERRAAPETRPAGG